MLSPDLPISEDSITEETPALRPEAGLARAAGGVPTGAPGVEGWPPPEAGGAVGRRLHSRSAFPGVRGLDQWRGSEEVRAGVVHGSPLTDLYPVIGLTRSGRLMAIWIGPCWPTIRSEAPLAELEAV